MPLPQTVPIGAIFAAVVSLENALNRRDHLFPGDFAPEIPSPCVERDVLGGVTLPSNEVVGVVLLVGALKPQRPGLVTW